jgi:hypothetical protein
MEDYDIPGIEGLDLHHFYRAMAWLGEELEEKPEGALAPRWSVEADLHRADASKRSPTPGVCSNAYESSQIKLL